MEKNNEEIKNCETCKYYSKHYVKRGQHFRSTCYGQCGKRHFKHAIKGDEFFNCGYWEQAEERVDNRQKAVKKILEDVDDKLQLIIDILSYEE